VCVLAAMACGNQDVSQEDALKQRMSALLAQTDDPLDKLTAMCLCRGYGGILALGRLFRRRDADGSWSLSMGELEGVLREFGLELGGEEVRDLFGQFDQDEDGSISYEEFLDAIRPPMSDPRKEAVAMAFNLLDVTEDGLVNIEDLRHRYNASAHPKVMAEEQSEEEVVQRFLGRFDNHIADDGMMTKAEFFDYYTGVSKSIDEDEYFVAMMKNVWGDWS